MNPGKDLVRAADAAQYEREPIPKEQRGQIRVSLLNATPDPLGSLAALNGIYKGQVVRSLAEVSDADRQQALEDLGKTVLNGPLEAVTFHFLIEGLDRAITHQMVRNRFSFFAQESLRFAVPTGDWSEEVALPPSLQHTEGNQPLGAETDRGEYARNLWDEQMRNTARTYAGLLDCGVPAEEARGLLPHAMPTRIHWVTSLRTLIGEAGKRTCTQAQFPWRVIFAQISKALRTYRAKEVASGLVSGWDSWQFELIADMLRPVCFQTGRCGFKAEFDRACSIRERVDLMELSQIPPSDWNSVERLDGHLRKLHEEGGDGPYKEDGMARSLVIHNAEWAADPGAARS